MYSTTEIAAATESIHPKGVASTSKEAEMQDLLADVADCLALDSDATLYLLRKLRDTAIKYVVTAQADVDTIQDILAKLSIRLKPPTTDYTSLKNRLKAVRDSEDSLTSTRKVGLVSSGVDDVVQGMGRATTAGTVMDSKEAYRKLKPALESLDESWESANSIQARFVTVLADVASVSRASLSRQASSGLAYVEKAEGLQAAGTHNPRETSASLFALKGVLAAKATVPDPLAIKVTATTTPAGTIRPAATPISTLSAPFVTPSAASLVVDVDAVGSTTWTLPVASYAALTTTVSWPVVVAPGPSLVLDYTVDGSVESVSIPSGSYTNTAMAALLDAELGVSASVVGGQVLMRSDTAGDHSTLLLGSGSANSALGWYSGQKHRGRHVLVSDLLASAGNVGLAYRLVSTIEHRGVLGTITGINNTTTVTVTLPSDVVAGDVLFINEEPAVGAYRIISRTLGTLVLDAGVQTGTYTGRVFNQRIALESLSTTVASKLLLSAGTGVTALGLTSGNYYGLTRKLDFGATLPDAVPPVRVGDIVTGDSDVRITGISGNIVTLEAEYSTSASSEEVIYPLGATKYTATATALNTWKSSAASWEGMAALSKKLLRIMTGAAGVSTADASLLSLDTLLASLKAALELYDAVVVEAVDQVLATLRDRGLDRASDMLTTGQMSDFFALTANSASYKGHAQESVSALSSEFPLPGGVSLVDVMEDGIADAELDAEFTVEEDESDDHTQYMSDEDEDEEAY